MQVPDGVNSLLVGQIGTDPTPLVIAGGNCSVQGFNADGDDHFWTVNVFFRFYVTYVLVKIRLGETVFRINSLCLVEDLDLDDGCMLFVKCPPKLSHNGRAAAFLERTCLLARLTNGLLPHF